MITYFKTKKRPYIAEPFDEQFINQETTYKGSKNYQSKFYKDWNVQRK